MTNLRAFATASGSDRWLNCPVSVKLSVGVLEKEHKYATEGTDNHSEGYEHLKNGTNTENPDLKIYIDFIRNRIPGPYILEERLPLLGSSGQIDCYAIQDNRAYLFDLKYGIGVPVFAPNNPQIAFYACAIKDRHPEIKSVETWIIQPRVRITIDGLEEEDRNVSTWNLTESALKTWKQIFSDGLDKVENDGTQKRGDWCRFCKAKPFCKLWVDDMDKATTELINVVAAAKDNLPIVGDLKIIEILRYKKAYNNWALKAEEYLIAKILGGQADEETLKLVNLKQGRSTRKWISTLTAEELMAELKNRGLTELFKTELLSPAQAEKKVNIQGLTEKPEGAPKLAFLKGAVEEDED